MEKYICTICEYVYDPEQGDPENGIEPGTSFEDLPADWVCPLCGVGKDEFGGCVKTLAQPLLYFTVLLYFLLAMLLFPHAFGNKLLYSNYIGL